MEEIIIREKDLIQVSGNPIDLKAIQGIKVNGESKITATEKVKLDRLLTDTLKVKAEILETMKREVRRQVITEEKKAAGVPKIERRLRAAEAKVEAIKAEISDSPFDDDAHYNYRHEHMNDGLAKSGEHKAEADRIRAKIKAAQAGFESQLNWLAKVRAKLLLCETKADALIIFNAVYGNGDGILGG